jgi:hypothetical protein
MAVTQAEVLELFQQVAAINNSDQLLMIKANQNGSVSAAKITAELLRAYLNAGFAITIDSEGYFCIGGVRTETMAGSSQMIVQTDTAAIIRPNVLNVWGNVSSLAVGFVPGAQGSANEYMLEFTVASDNFTLSLPSSVRWSEEPEWTNGNTYQVSIENNLALYAGWEAAST